MIRVIDYLDDYFSSTGIKFSCKKKKNGHYNIQGSWKNCEDKDNRIICLINNETIIIDILIDGKMVGWYHYLQTYEHIPRGDPDKHGYYARSTPEEIIKYLDTYLEEIRKVRNRRSKINKIMKSCQ